MAELLEEFGKKLCRLLAPLISASLRTLLHMLRSGAQCWLSCGWFLHAALASSFHEELWLTLIDDEASSCSNFAERALTSAQRAWLQLLVVLSLGGLRELRQALLQLPQARRMSFLLFLCLDAAPRMKSPCRKLEKGTEEEVGH